MDKLIEEYKKSLDIIYDDYLCSLDNLKHALKEKKVRSKIYNKSLNY